MKKLFQTCFRLSVMVLILPMIVSAHDAEFPSIHDTVAKIKAKLVKEYPADKLPQLTPTQIWEFLSEQEREIVSTSHIHFSVNQPVDVLVFRDKTLGPEPFWLKERDFQKTDYEIQVDDEFYDGWVKSFGEERIGLGINSFADEGEQYFIVLLPRASESKPLGVQDLYPGQCRITALNKGVRPYIDDDDPIVAFPEKLKDAVLIQVSEDWESTAAVTEAFHLTRFPSSNEPDQIVLTWSADPATTQTIQWRTGPDSPKGVVAFQKKSEFGHFFPKTPTLVTANTQKLETNGIVNDPLCHRHSVTLNELEPDTTYVYSVGDGSDEHWSAMAEFTTAPAGTVPFSFVYMGDAQNGLDRWGSLVHNAFQSHPDAAFYIMAGDLVNRGNERWDWDDFFYNARGIFDRRPVVPAIGNHECQDGRPWLYLALFTLPHNGPSSIEPERAYSLRYSNALFLILDSNLDPEDQAEWLEQQLADTDATWKFVVYHHPAYSSKPNRDNVELRQTWVPLFDRYHVDMVLQGHDHAYLRTHPMKDNEVVDSPQEGTLYVVSVSGVKMYDQADRDYTAIGITNTSMYQVLDIQIAGDRLLYRAYDIDGNLRDEITIEK